MASSSGAAVGFTAQSTAHSEGSRERKTSALHLKEPLSSWKSSQLCRLGLMSLKQTGCLGRNRQMMPVHQRGLIYKTTFKICMLELVIVSITLIKVSLYGPNTNYLSRHSTLMVHLSTFTPLLLYINTILKYQCFYFMLLYSSLNFIWPSCTYLTTSDS